MMIEYIERKAATTWAPLPKALREYQTGNLDDAFEDGYYFAIEQIDAIPAANVRPVIYGKWEYVSFMTVRCSNCKETFHELEADNFCPNCGADMRGEDQ